MFSYVLLEEKGHCIRLHFAGILDVSPAIGREQAELGKDGVHITLAGLKPTSLQPARLAKSLYSRSLPGVLYPNCSATSCTDQSETVALSGESATRQGKVLVHFFPIGRDAHAGNKHLRDSSS